MNFASEQELRQSGILGSTITHNGMNFTIISDGPSGSIKVCILSSSGAQHQQEQVRISRQPGANSQFTRFPRRGNHPISAKLSQFAAPLADINEVPQVTNQTGGGIHPTSSSPKPVHVPNALQQSDAVSHAPIERRGDGMRQYEQKYKFRFDQNGEPILTLNHGETNVTRFFTSIDERPQLHENLINVSTFIGSNISNNIWFDSTTNKYYMSQTDSASASAAVWYLYTFKPKPRGNHFNGPHQ